MFSHKATTYNLQKILLKEAHLQVCPSRGNLLVQCTLTGTPVEAMPSEMVLVLTNLCKTVVDARGMSI